MLKGYVLRSIWAFINNVAYSTRTVEMGEKGQNALYPRMDGSLAEQLGIRVKTDKLKVSRNKKTGSVSLILSIFFIMLIASE